MGENMLIGHIRKCFNDKLPLPDALHKKAMFLFKQYMLVGSMPKAVDKFISDNKQFCSCDLNVYRDDIHKIDRNYRSKVISLFDQIPSFLYKIFK